MGRGLCCSHISAHLLLRAPPPPSITGVVPESTLPNTTCCRDKLPEELHLRCCPKASAPNQRCTAPFPQRCFPSKTQVKGTRVHLIFSRGPEPALNPRVPSASRSPESLGGGWASLFLCFNTLANQLCSQAPLLFPRVDQVDHGLKADDRLLQAHRGGPEKEREQRGDWIAGSQGKVTALSLSPPLDKEGNQHPTPAGAASQAEGGPRANGPP